MEKKRRTFSRVLFLWDIWLSTRGGRNLLYLLPASIDTENGNYCVKYKTAKLRNKNREKLKNSVNGVFSRSIWEFLDKKHQWRIEFLQWIATENILRERKRGKITAIYIHFGVGLFLCFGYIGGKGVLFDLFIFFSFLLSFSNFFILIHKKLQLCLLWKENVLWENKWVSTVFVKVWRPRFEFQRRQNTLGYSSHLS